MTSPSNLRFARPTMALALLAMTLAPALPAFADDTSRAATESPVDWDKEREFAARLNLDGLRAIAIQEGGRRKPFDTFAREYVFKVTDRKRFQKLDPVFTVLSMAYESDKWHTRRCIAIRNLELIELLTNDGKRKLGQPDRRAGDRLFVSPADLRANIGLRRVFEKARRKAQQKIPRDAVERAALTAFEKAFMVDATRRMFTIVPVSDNVVDSWTTVEASEAALFKDLHKAHSQVITALRARKAEQLNAALDSFVTTVKGYDFKVWPYYGLLELELFMNKTKPFSIVQLVYFLAIIAFITALFDVKGARKIGFALFGVALVIHIGALTGRGFLVSRSPVASLYETLVFMTGFAAVLAAGLEIAQKGPSWFALSASVLSMFGLFLGDWSPIYATKQDISPLVPVLRSYWLNIHVTCMIASYGACLLAAGIGATYLVRWCLAGGSKAIAEEPSMQAMDTYIYRTVQVAFLLLTVGIILGGVWANQSWGRYWDWDPKETWAFITWIAYAVYLHLRMTNVARGPGAAVASLVGFWFVMFTYLGVSYVLPGLHSYVQPGDDTTIYSTVKWFVWIPAVIVAAYGALYAFGRSRAGAAGAETASETTSETKVESKAETEAAGKA